MDNIYIFPAFLFPVIPLMMISFGNRYTSMSTLIRQLHGELIKNKKSLGKKARKRYIAEISTLTKRLKINRLVQTLGGIALLTNLLSINFAYQQQAEAYMFTFGLALIFFAVAILLFVLELQLSVTALKKHLEDLGDI